jgi:hypothetical protein
MSAEADGADVLPENPLGSLIGNTDASGKPTREVHYNEYGEPLGQEIRFSARPENIQAVSFNGTYKETIITLTGTSAPAGMDGMEVRVAIPGDPNRRYRTARIQHGSGTSLVLWEPTATTNQYVHEAIDPSGSIDAGFVVYDNPDGMVDGRWDSVAFDGIYTTFVDDHRNFNTNYDGKTFEFLMGIAGQTVPVDQVLGGNLQVLGDQTGSVFGNDRYRGPNVKVGGTIEETNSGFWWEDPTYAAGETNVASGGGTGPGQALRQFPRVFGFRDVSCAPLLVEASRVLPERLLDEHGKDSLANMLRAGEASEQSEAEVRRFANRSTFDSNSPCSQPNFAFS